MRSFMKSAIALVLSASNVLAQEMAYFENWVAGCDNLRSCSAIGLPEEGVAEIGFVKIERGGAAKAAPLVTFGFYDVEPRTDRKLEVFLDDQEVGGFISEQDGVYTKAVLSGQNADAFFVALGKARQLRISRSDKNGRALARVVIAVAGSVPSLRFVDDRQMRGGTVTASSTRAGSPLPGFPQFPRRRLWRRNQSKSSRTVRRRLPPQMRRRTPIFFLPGWHGADRCPPLGKADTMGHLQLGSRLQYRLLVLYRRGGAGHPGRLRRPRQQ